MESITKCILEPYGFCFHREEPSLRMKWKGKASEREELPKVRVFSHFRAAVLGTVTQPRDLFSSSFDNLKV